MREQRTGNHLPELLDHAVGHVGTVMAQAVANHAGKNQGYDEQIAVLNSEMDSLNSEMDSLKERFDKSQSQSQLPTNRVELWVLGPAQNFILVRRADTCVYHTGKFAWCLCT